VKAIVFVDGRFVRDIQVSEFVYSVLPPSYNQNAIKDLASSTGIPTP
jgi:hypothetical protein